MELKLKLDTSQMCINIRLDTILATQ